MKTVRATVMKANVSEITKQIYEDGFNYEIDDGSSRHTILKSSNKWPSILPFFSNASMLIKRIF